MRKTLKTGYRASAKAVSGCELFFSSAETKAGKTTRMQNTGQLFAPVFTLSSVAHYA
jgi:hypothetical protein